MKNSKIQLLKPKVITKELKQLPSWKLSASKTTLMRTFTFNSHIDALTFIARITVHAQVLSHHPDITFTFKKVKVLLSTHEAKGLTALDIELAKRISHFA